MNKFLQKKLYLLGIKYGPSVMALTCCSKIFFDSIDDSPGGLFEEITHFINLILAFFIIGMFYITGLYFQYCWKHQSLCRIAAWGYLYYFFFLIIKPPQEIIITLATWYMIFTIIVTFGYKNV